MPLTSSRRNGSAGGTPLWLIFFGIFLVFSLAVTGAIYRAADTSSREELARRADARLAPLVDAKIDFLKGVTAATEAALGAACAWELSDSGDIEAVRLILESLPHLHSLTIVLGDDEAIRIQRDGKTWLHQEMNLSQGTGEWARWDAQFSRVLSIEDEEPLRENPRESEWYKGALARMRSRADENRDTPPLTFWATPLRIGATGQPGIFASVALKRVSGAPVAFAFAVDLSPLATDTTSPPQARPDTTMVLSESAGVLVLPRGAQAEGSEALETGFAPLAVLEDLPIAAAFQRWQNETDPEESAFRVELAGAFFWNHFIRFQGMGGQTLWIGAAIPENALRVDFLDLRTQLLLILSAAIGCALVVSLLLAAGLARPVRIFSNRVWQIDLGDPKHAYLPRSRVREFNELSSAINALLADTPSDVTPESHVAAPPVATDATASPSPDADDYPAPPQAYVQALQSSRRQLRALQGHLETLQQQISADDGPRTSSEAHWKTLLQKLSVADDRPARATLLEAGCMLAGAERCGLWQVDGDQCVLLERYDMLGNAFDEGRACNANDLPQGLLDAAHGPILTMLDAAGMAGFPPPGEDAHPAATALVVTFLGEEGQTLLVVLEQVSAAVRWTSLQEQNALALAALFCLSEAPDTPEIILSNEPSWNLETDAVVEREFDEAPLYRQLIQSVGQPLAAILPDGRISFVNTAFEDFFDRDAPELLGYLYWDLVSEDSLDMVCNTVATIMASGRGQTIVAWHRTDGNPPAQLHMDLSALEDEHGEITGTVVRLRPVQPETE